MNDVTIDDWPEPDDLAPEERFRTAAQILARGIRRLLLRTAPGVGREEPASQPIETAEKSALPGCQDRALMSIADAG
jgi:hypothetical protein